VSVVMPVHNALPYLDAAVESVLGQNFSDFEFVILDDASTDGSTEQLREWAGKDSRIRLIEGKTNLGPALSSQRVAQAARAPVVARQDADDISEPERLNSQLEVLNSNTEVGVVGGLYDIIDAQGRIIRKPDIWRLLHPTMPPFGNGPLMYRKSVFEQVGGYREECEFWEDKDLIIRMAAVSKVAVVAQSIYRVRQSTASTRIASEQARLERAIDLMYRCIAQLEQCGNYEDLLQNRHLQSKVDPRVFISLGSILLWSGGRPRVFRRMLRRAKLGIDFRSMVGIVWAAWASLSPSTLRVFLRLLLRIRNAFSYTPVVTDGAVLWPPSRKSQENPLEQFRVS
jgi:glycosyltransferase involved in cell wall biosynthesis